MLFPTYIFDDVEHDGPLSREEIFGLVSSIITFDTGEEAIRVANEAI